MVGASAKRQAVHQPEEHLLRGEAPDRPQVQRRRGQKDIGLVPYAIVEHDNGDAWVATADGKKLSPQEVSARSAGEDEEDRPRPISARPSPKR
jgi:molecular chaperone DnaK